VLLQVAHPLVATGVVHHSDYRTTCGGASCARCGLST
jgi:hypothetical protein